MFVYVPIKRLVLRLEGENADIHDRIMSEYYKFLAFAIFLKIFIFF